MEPRDKKGRVYTRGSGAGHKGRPLVMQEVKTKWKRPLPVPSGDTPAHIYPLLWCWQIEVWRVNKEFVIYTTDPQNQKRIKRQKTEKPKEYSSLPVFDKPGFCLCTTWLVRNETKRTIKSSDNGLRDRRLTIMWWQSGTRSINRQPGSKKQLERDCMRWNHPNDKPGPMAKNQFCSALFPF